MFKLLCYVGWSVLLYLCLPHWAFWLLVCTDLSFKLGRWTVKA